MLRLFLFKILDSLPQTLLSCRSIDPILIAKSEPERKI